MTKLSENEMVELLEATEGDRALLAARMAPALDERTAAWFEKEVQNKNLNVTAIIQDGTKIGAIWWWYSPTNRSLVLNGGASFVPERNTTAAFMVAYLELAKQCGASSMELQTSRAGVVKVYRRCGWQVEGLTLRMVL